MQFISSGWRCFSRKALVRKSSYSCQSVFDGRVLDNVVGNHLLFRLCPLFKQLVVNGFLGRKVLKYRLFCYAQGLTNVANRCRFIASLRKQLLRDVQDLLLPHCGGVSLFASVQRGRLRYQYTDMIILCFESFFKFNESNTDPERPAAVQCSLPDPYRSRTGQTRPRCFPSLLHQ